MKPAAAPLAAAAVLLLAVSVGIQVVRDRGYQPYEPESALLWIRSGPLMKRLALGFDTLLADVYWMRAVVYYGGQRQLEPEEEGAAGGTQPDAQDAAGAGARYALLAPMLDLVTTLDPRFTVAYRFGAIFLTEAYPSGPGRPDLSVALLEKGIEQDRGRWEYMHDIGFVYYWWLHDYPKAAEWFRRAEAAPDGPSWLGPLAANTLAAGGSREASRALWQQIQETTENDWIRTSAARSLMQLDALDVVDQLNVLAERFEASAGRPPASLEELARAAGLRGVPLDPTGVPFELDAGTGQVTISQESSLWPPPHEPARADPGADRVAGRSFSSANRIVGRSFSSAGPGGTEVPPYKPFCGAAA